MAGFSPDLLDQHEPAGHRVKGQNHRGAQALDAFPLDERAGVRTRHPAGSVRQADNARAARTLPREAPEQ